MTDEKTESDQPLFAYIDEGKSSEGDTVVALSLFGHKTFTYFSERDHKDKAAAWVNRWNERLDQGWMGVRETTAHIMQDFIYALRAEGVSLGLIDDALARVRKHAGT